MTRLQLASASIMRLHRPIGTWGQGRCNLHVDWEEGRDLRAVGHEECVVRLCVAAGHDNHRGTPLRTQPPLRPVDHASAESQPRARRVHGDKVRAVAHDADRRAAVAKGWLVNALLHAAVLRGEGGARVAAELMQHALGLADVVQPRGGVGTVAEHDVLVRGAPPKRVDVAGVGVLDHARAPCFVRLTQVDEHNVLGVACRAEEVLVAPLHRLDDAVLVERKVAPDRLEAGAAHLREHDGAPARGGLLEGHPAREHVAFQLVHGPRLVEGHELARRARPIALGLVDVPHADVSAVGGGEEQRGA
mmetsp:Transcript_2427/g.5336  ORF Transcript_2427/g.5336 Transcript_2427/m.5336 type:complete len:304 (+) Transcript_2427:81-992(+)